MCDRSIVINMSWSSSGDEQSGEMQQIGFQLYSDMLKAAVDGLKSGREPNLTEPLGVTTEISLHVPALLPEDYCNDVHERLVLFLFGLAATLRRFNEGFNHLGLPPLAGEGWVRECCAGCSSPFAV